MSEITKIYKSKFKESLSPLGFKLYRKTFYREVNDVVQMMMLDNWDSRYTVNYGVQPLCLGLTSLEFDGRTIHEYRKGDFDIGHREWEVFCHFAGEKASNEELGKYVDEMLSIVHSHVMPYFERRVDWQSWLNQFYKRDGTEYDAWIEIKVGNYEKAIPTIQKQLERKQAVLQIYYADPDDPYGLKKMIKNKIIKEKDFDLILEKHIASENEVRKDIEKLTRYIKLLSIPDTEYFDKIFAENETKSREYLSNPRKYKQKHGY